MKVFKVGDTAYITLKDISKMNRYMSLDETLRGKRLTIVEVHEAGEDCTVMWQGRVVPYMIPRAFLRKTKPPKGKTVDQYALLENKDGQF